MCNGFLRQCYWKSPGTSFEADLSQNSFLGAKNRFSAVPDTLRRSLKLLELKVLKLSLNV